jgi:peptidoglycan/xylan/chitin deacetylase (PgdA/CDA1 family)
VGTPRFLSGADVRHIRSRGHLIGSHSHTHPNIFCDLSTRQMVEEWRVSRERLSDLLGEPVDTASVPGGDVSRRVFDSAASEGVRYLFTSEPWLRPRRVDGCWILGRVIVKNTTKPRQVRELAHLRGWTAALLERRVKVMARRAAPSLYRRYVTASTREA